MIQNGKAQHWAYPGCSCCCSKQERRTARKQNKRVEERKWKKEYGVG